MILNAHPDQSNLGLKALGYWNSNYEPHLPDPRNYVGQWPSSEIKQVVVSYVKSAPAILHWSGFSSCRFGCGSGFHMGTTCLSDNTYVWPEGFHHYLEAHDVVPPAEFIKHVLTSTGQTNLLEQALNVKLAKYIENEKS